MPPKTPRSSTPSKPASGSTRLIMCCRAAARQRSPRLLRELTIHARQNGVKLPFTANTPYINTISADEQALMPGSPDLERRIKSLVRWNAMAMVVRANKREDGIGGHISTFASAATLYEVGFNHFFRGRDDGNDGDVIYLPGPRRARHLRARLPRRPPRRASSSRTSAASCKPGGGLSSYPHPWLMPDFWEYPDGLDGPRPDHGDLPGALHALPRGSRPQAEVRRQGLGVPRRRRDRRARSRSARSRCRRAKSSTT